MESRSALVAVAFALAAASATPALAQDGGVNGHGFGMTAQDGDVRDPLTVERPGALNAGDFYGTALFEYAAGTMALVSRDPEGNVGGTDVYLDRLFGVNLGGGVSVHKMLRFDLRLPVFFSARGFNANNPSGQPIGGGLGTMRAAAMFAPVTPGADGGFGFGVVPWLDLPTATASKNMGIRGVGGGTKVAATIEAGKLTIGADLGVVFRPSIEGFENLQGGAQLATGLAAGVALNDNIGINLEANLNPSLKGKPDIAGVPGWAESPSEALLSVRGRTAGGPHWLVGGGTALSPGVGASKFRIFAGGGFGKISDAGGKPKIGDKDNDGIADDVDQCPEIPEVVNDYKDDDGCADALGNLSVVAKNYGEIVPNVELTITGMGDSRTVKSGGDAVTLKDLMPGAYDVRSIDPNYEGNVQLRVKEGDNRIEVEVMPTKPGTLNVSVVDEAGAAINGALVTVAAPGAGDGKSIAIGAGGTGSAEFSPGYYSVFVQAEGYAIYREDLSIVASEVAEVKAVLQRPKTEVKKERIEILEKVFFAQGSSTIEARSFPLLDEVANVMLRNSDIKIIEIAGHTSSEGALDLNNRLSKDRAQAVMRYLIERGVSENRLQAVGYGPSQPLVPEKTEADRAKNRRVEFVIKKRVTTK